MYAHPFTALRRGLAASLMASALAALPTGLAFGQLPPTGAVVQLAQADPSPAAIAAAAGQISPGVAAEIDRFRAQEVTHRTVTIDGIDLFVREAGPADAPVLLLLHGFPTSSSMFRVLMPRLADRYRVIAPDYPGYGFSEQPPRAAFDYTFDRIAELVTKLTDELGVDRYTLYVMDYGAPVGWRLALARPDRVQALIVQNGNAYDEGLREFWDPIKAYWATGGAAEREALRPFTQAPATRWQYEHGVPDDRKSLLDPSQYTLDQTWLDRPENAEIQLDLFYDYRMNLPLYPRVQQFLRDRQPPTLIVWGRNDPIFPAEGATPYLRDLPKAELHLLDTGHFALETHGPEIAALIRDFLGRTLAP